MRKYFVSFSYEVLQNDRDLCVSNRIVEKEGPLFSNVEELRELEKELSRNWKAKLIYYVELA